MIVTKNDLVIYIDVDETLIFECDKNHPNSIKVNYYGQNKFIRPHNRHVNFIMSLKNRGYHVIVHSANGWKWAEHIIKKLKLDKYVHEVKSKSVKFVDDKEPDTWMGQRIYLEEN